MKQKRKKQWFDSEREKINYCMNFHKANYEKAKEDYEKYKRKKQVGITWKGIWDAVYNVVIYPFFYSNRIFAQGAGASRLPMSGLSAPGFFGSIFESSLKERIMNKLSDIARYYANSLIISFTSSKPHFYAFTNISPCRISKMKRRSVKREQHNLFNL